MFFDVVLTFFDVDLSFFDVDLSFAPSIHRARTVQTPTLNGSFSTFARTFPTCAVAGCRGDPVPARYPHKGHIYLPLSPTTFALTGHRADTGPLHQQISTTGHILVHDYFRISIEILWIVIKEDISLLKEQVTKYISEIG